MVIAFLSMLVAGGPQFQSEGLPTFNYTAAFSAGQREIVLGPIPYHDVTMEVRYEKDTDAQYTPNKIIGPSWEEYATGYVRWDVSDTTLFDKPCRKLRMEGITKGKNSTKTKDISYATRNSTTYWITPEGKVLRQHIQLVDPSETKTAEAVFWSDHIEVSVDDKRGRRSFTVYPNVDLSLIDMQFKPMMEGDKVVLPYKEYYVFEPFTQAFIKYKAAVGGTFHGTWLAMKFDGTHIDIDGPRGRIIAYISKEGDLVKADLGNNRSLVLNNLPESRDPKYKASVGHGG